MPVHEVREFLLRFKRAVTAGTGVLIAARASTRATLLELGLTEANLEEILLALSIRDYCSGPERDRDRDYAKCISFHFAEHPLAYPHRQ